MSATRRLDGQVVDETGRPLEGAAVVVEWGTAATPEIAAVTDAYGCFAMSLPPGRYRLAARAEGDRQGKVEVDEDDRTIEIGVAPH